MNDTFAGFLLGMVTMFLAIVLVASSSGHDRRDKEAFIQRCASDNGVAIFADNQYCIKRSALVETVR
jgi:hypothetical protein